MAYRTTVMTPREFSSFPDAPALSRAAAARICEGARRAIENQGRFRLVLSGGSTPRRLYEELAANWADRIPWEQTEIFWGDERIVSPDDPLSNYGLAHEYLLQHVNIPTDRVFPMFRKGNAAEAARTYESLLRQQQPQDIPSFDLILLGIGPDGHTASLFPGQTAIRETDRLIIEVPAPHHIEPHVARITMTLPLINAADTVLFLAGGSAKKEIIEAVRQEDQPGRSDLPAAMVAARKQTLWFIAGDAS